MKSARVIRSNFLERIADPASQFYPDSLSYRNGEITKGELVARLPHVAVVGDSVCMDIYISSPLSTLWRAHSRRGTSWFLDNSAGHQGIRSVCKRLEEITPFVAIQRAGIGALVDHEECRLGFFRRVLGTRSFSGQITQLLRAPVFLI